MMSLQSALREHWPEYLMEGWALGSFMVAVGVFATVLGSPGSLASHLVPSAIVRTVLLGLAMGVTAVLLIHSPWGKRSGAHMNPAVTLAFLRLGKIHRWDALFYIVAQTVGGTLGVVLVASVAGSLFTAPPVSYAATVPGPNGVTVAFVAEAVISFGLMSAILALFSSSRLTRFTGIAVGCLVALYISVESPLSGTSMNPARTLASAARADPNTGWLAASGLELDRDGFVRTEGGCTARQWAFESSIPGVFAIGDVRSGSTKRLAATVGEGAQVIATIHRSLGRSANYPVTAASFGSHSGQVDENSTGRVLLNSQLT
jgi:aquaporin Z